MTYQFTTVPISPNPYFACTINNMDFIITLNHEKKDQTRKYHNNSEIGDNGQYLIVNPESSQASRYCK